MSAILPQDLLNIPSTKIHDTPSTNHDDILFERAQVLHMFWKVHAVRYRVSRHISDERSRNLFWRTWSNPKLSHSVSTSTLTRLWDICRGGLDLSSFDLVVHPPLLPSDVAPTTETSSPSLVSVHNQSLDHKSSQQDVLDLVDNDTDISHNTLHNDGILKEMVRHYPPDGLNVGNGPREEASSSRPKLMRNASSKNAINRASAGARERGGTKGRARPSLGRRRSTQNSKMIKSPTLDSFNVHTETNYVEPLPSDNHSPATTLPRASSWEDDPSNESGRVSPAEYAGEPNGFSVEKDFRSRFTERIASSSNLTGMNRIRKTGSVVRFADEVPVPFSKPKEPLSTTFEDQARPPLPHRQSDVSVAISDGDAEEDQAILPSLQRTGSSLSMLLRKAQLEDGSLPTEMPLVHNRSREKGKEKNTKKDIIQEAALLEMGWRGGVTKAGGIQLPLEQQLRDEFDSRSSSSSPDRIF